MFPNRPASRQGPAITSPQTPNHPTTVHATQNDLNRPASRQSQHPSQTYPPQLPQENVNSNLKQPNRLSKLRQTNGSSASLQHVPAKRDAPYIEHTSRQVRPRAQSFSHPTSAVTRRTNLSWPPISVVRDVEHRAPIRRRILFYHKHHPYYGFTNFSAHSVIYDGKKYPTSEHLFQSFKFQGHRPGLAEHIRLCCLRPNDALSESRRFQPEVRSDWMKVNIEKMDETLWHKFNQHSGLREELLATGDAELVEDSDKDSFWGVGADRKGRNELGKALERLREKLLQK